MSLTLELMRGFNATGVDEMLDILWHDLHDVACLWYLINIVLLRTKGSEKSVSDWVSRCIDAARKKNMKTQLLFMTSLQSPTFWRGLTFGGHIDRYFLGLPYTKGYD